MLKRLKRAWKRDRLGVLGVGSAVVAFVMLIAPPVTLLEHSGWWPFSVSVSDFMNPKCEPYPTTGLSLGVLFAQVTVWWCVGGTHSVAFVEALGWGVWWDERLPAIAAFLALAVILLLLRRR